MLMRDENDSRSHLEASLLDVYPGYDGRVVARVVQEVPYEDIKGRQGQLGRVLPGSPSLSLASLTSRGGRGRSWGDRGGTRCWRREPQDFILDEARVPGRSDGSTTTGLAASYRRRALTTVIGETGLTSGKYCFHTIFF